MHNTTQGQVPSRHQFKKAPAKNAPAKKRTYKNAQLRGTIKNDDCTLCVRGDSEGISSK